jgi:hypothetical protein
MSRCDRRGGTENVRYVVTRRRSWQCEAQILRLDGITCLSIVIIGFMPTYFLPLAQGRFQAPPIMHVHGAVFFASTALFCVQTFPVANGARLAHRTRGLLGIAIATSMVFLVLATILVRINMMDAAGYGAGMRPCSHSPSSI